MAKAIVVRILGEAKDALDAIEKVGRKAGDLGPLVAKAGLAAGAAAGTALVAGTLDALNQQAVTDAVASSLGLSGGEAAALGKQAGDLYAGAYGSSFENVAETLRTAVAVDIPAEQLEAITGRAFSLESAFGGVASEYITMADTFAEQGLVDSAAEGLDFITTSFQGLPAEMQAPLLEAANEYSGFMQDLGFTTEQTFGLLASAAAEGEFALDKTGDAIKEFGIRATDGSAASSAAYDAIGLDATKMSNDLLAGGETAGAAFDQIVAGLLAIEDPTERANASIALFGTPLEDLGVNGIPDFLSGLQNMDAGMGDVAGSAAALDAELNDNLKMQIESVKRQAFQALAAFVVDVMIPAIEDAVAAFRTVSDWVRENRDYIIGALSALAGLILVTLGPAFAVWAVGAAAAAAATILAALPIIALVAAVAAVGVAIVWLLKNWDEVWAKIKEIASAAWGFITGVFAAAWGWIKSSAADAAGWFVAKFVELKDGAAAQVSGLVDAVVGFIASMPGRVSSAASGMFDGIKTAFRSAVNWIIDKWNGLEFTIGGGSFAGVPIPSMTLGTPDIRRFHSGGVVPGRYGEEVFALLQAGETVRTREQEAALGGGIRIENLYVTERDMLSEFAELEARYGVLV